MNEEFNKVTPQYYEDPQSNGDRSNGMAIASMVPGIVSIVLSCLWYISVPSAIASLVLGIMHNKKNGKCGMSTAGIVCSVIGLVLTILLIVLAVIGLAVFGGMAALSNYY